LKEMPEAAALESLHETPPAPHPPPPRQARQ
jgi:hypothetical protein